MRRVALLLSILLAMSACSNDRPPTADEVMERWPNGVATPSPAPAGVQEHYRELYMTRDIFAGVDDIEFYTLSGEVDLGFGHWAVVVVSSRVGLSSDEVNQLRCDHLYMIGQTDNGTDEYAGVDGLHGHDGWFSVNADGTAVLVMSAFDGDEAHDVARALGGEDEDDTPPCGPTEFTPFGPEDVP